MCSYSWGIKCGIREFIGRSERKIGRGREIMAARMAAQRRGLPDETEIERCLLFWTFAWPMGSIQYTNANTNRIIILDCPHSLFPHQQVFLGSWLVGITQVNKWTLATGRDHPSIGGVYYIHPNYQIFL